MIPLTSFVALGTRLHGGQVQFVAVSGQLA